MEQKHYPRDPQRDQIHTGRVRVQLINEEGEFFNDLAQNSKCLPTHVPSEGGGRVYVIVLELAL